MTLRQVALINNGGGGTSGSPVTAGNSGGASGNPFDGNLASSGATLAYDSTHTPNPAYLAFKVATTTSGSAYVSWAASMTGANGGANLAQAWFRAYLYFTANPSAATTVFFANEAGGGGGTCATVKITTTGKVAAFDGTGTQQVITTGSIPLNQWFRIEGFVVGNASTGQLSLTLFDSADSTIATEGPHTATGLNTQGTMTGWRFGQATNVASIGPYWIANVGLSNAGYLGPTPYGFTPVRAGDGGGAMTNVTVQGAYPNGLMVAGGDVEGIFTTGDYGQHWRVSNTGVSGIDWRRTATTQWSAYEANTVYSCVGLNGANGGFMAGVSNGTLWSMRSTAVQFSGNTTGIANDPSRSAGNLLAQAGTQANPCMYTATYKGGVFRSTDTTNPGTHWTNIGLAGGSHFGRGIATGATKNDVYASMYGEGVYHIANASTGSPSAPVLMSGSPAQAEEMVYLPSSGNLYVAAGKQGLAQYDGSSWTLFGGAGTIMSASSYWMAVDGYTDASGNDQLIVGCQNQVQGPSTGYRILVWVTINGTTGNATYTDLTAVLADVQYAYIPPDTGRTWWHSDTSVPNPSQATGYHEWLGGPGYFQPHPLIDKSTINTSNLVFYCAGAAGVYVSTGNTANASGVHNTAGGAGSPVQWGIAINGMAAYIGHQVVVNPSNPLQAAWATRDWGGFVITDGTGYNAATVTQFSPPRPGGAVIGGFAVAIDPPTGLLYLSTGTKGGANSAGQIYSWDNGFNPSNISTSGPGSGTFNAGQNVAYGLFAGRDGSNHPYLLALIQGSSANGGMYRFSGYTISGSNVVSGGSWTRVNSAIGTSGGASNLPPGPAESFAADPNHAGVIYVLDENSGLWRNSGYGAGTWTQLWAVTNNSPRSGDIAPNPNVAGELWVSYSGGLYKISNANSISSVNVGGNTTHITTLGQTPGHIAIYPNGDVYVIALDVTSGPRTINQLMGSFDGGATWFHADGGSIAQNVSWPSPGGMTAASNGLLYGTDTANITFYGYPAQPTSTPSAGMTATATMFAQPQDVPGGTKFGNASLSARATLGATSGPAEFANAALSATALMTIGGGAATFVIQQVPGVSLYDYGASNVEIATAAGNTLMVLAGWDLSAATAAGAMPAVYVTDSAGNLWHHVATTTASVPGSRCSAWICPNAAPVEWVSVTLTTFASSLAFTVLELNGQATLPDGSPAPAGTFMPAYYDLDIYDAAGQSAATTLTLSPGNTTDADFAFSVFCTASLTGSIPPAPPGWTSLAPVAASPDATGSYVGISNSAGGFTPSLPGRVNPVTLCPFYNTPALGASITTAYTQFATSPVSGITFAVKTTVFPPNQPNPNFPVLKVEAGFGSVPGDPSQPPPSWTDITNRVLAPEGQAFIKSVAGRQYELAQAEAGTLEVWVDNHDGAFTPGNTGSPYWPGVVLGTPLRVTAWWNGVWYPVAFGWAERWPQEWPDLPQWGISKAIFTDAISVMSAVTMYSALDSEILLDGPYVLFPAAEQYLSFVNGINNPASLTNQGGVLGSFVAKSAQGLLAQNYSRANQRAGIYVDGNSAGTGGSGNAIAATGQTTNLLGSSGTGFGTGAFTQAPASPACGPGVIYTDPNMPDPATGVTVSFWAIIGAQAVSAQLQPTVFTAYGTPSNYSTDPSLTVQVLNFTGNSLLQVTLADGTAVTAPFSGAAGPQAVMLIITASSLSVFINGSLQLTKGLTAAQTTAWSAVSWGCPNYAYGTEGLTAGNFTLFDLAVTGSDLAAQRAVAQYATGLFGQQNVDAVTRVAQILAWAGLGLPRAGRITFDGTTVGVLQGPAYSLAGTTASDAVNQVARNENSLIAATASGSLVFFHQWALFNQSPVAVLGDNPDPAQGQVPYLAGQTWGFDNTYLYNLASITQQYGPNNLITVTAGDFTSDSEYFSRTALSQTITTMSALDAFSLVSWIISKYSQPSLRVSTVTVDAASNPVVAFPAILPLQQGQVVTVTRSPVGGAAITQNCITEKIAHSIGPAMWQTAVQASPYTPEGAILQLDSPSNNTLGSNVLA